jgi:hypothetical protein
MSCWNELFVNVLSLNQIDNDTVDRDITYLECYEVLKSMRLGHSPAEHGITVEVFNLYRMLEFLN